MSLGDAYLPDFEQEMAATRRTLERVPGDKGAWKPHAKSFAFGHLAQLVSWMPAWIAKTLLEPTLDLGRTSGYSLEPTGTLLRGFDDNVETARTALRETPDSAWGMTWTLTRGGQTLWSAPRSVVVRNHLNHLIHHRAQLTVYLRLNDIPVPALYGPSADEQPF